MIREIVSCIVLSCLATGAGMGQAVESQQVTGAITDATGASVPGASVVVTNASTGLARTVTSNSDGLYTVLNLPVGTYTLTVTMQGFKTSVIDGVNVDVGAKPAVPVQLSIGAVGESVEVKADSATTRPPAPRLGR